MDLDGWLQVALVMLLVTVIASIKERFFSSTRSSYAEHYPYYDSNSLTALEVLMEEVLTRRWEFYRILRER
jgi:hypothetical protein